MLPDADPSRPTCKGLPVDNLRAPAPCGHPCTRYVGPHDHPIGRTRAAPKRSRNGHGPTGRAARSGRKRPARSVLVVRTRRFGRRRGQVFVTLGSLERPRRRPQRCRVAARSLSSVRASGGSPWVDRTHIQTTEPSTASASSTQPSATVESPISFRPGGEQHEGQRAPDQAARRAARTAGRRGRRPGMQPTSSEAVTPSWKSPNSRWPGRGRGDQRHGLDQVGARPGSRPAAPGRARSAR